VKVGDKNTWCSYLKEAILLYKHKSRNKVIDKEIELKPHYSTILYTGGVGLVGAYCIRPDEIRPNENNENNENNNKGVFNTPLRSPSQTVGADK